MPAETAKNAISQRAIGVLLQSEVRLQINWRSLADGIAAVLANGFSAAFGLSASPASALGGVVKAFSSIEAKKDPGEQAWRLVVLCTAWALNELRAGASFAPQQAKQLATLVVDTAKKQLSKNRYVLPIDALSRPSKIPFYMAVRDALIDHKKLYTTIEETDDSLRARFDSAFTIALFEIWSRKSESFNILLNSLDARVSAGARLEVEWEAYRQTLAYIFRVKPIFGQEERKISLSQLYIPLRAVWFKEQEDDKSEEPIQHAVDTRERYTVDLEEELADWLESDQEDYLRLLGGGPGSGKSTSLRAFASALSEKAEWRPLFVPLQHIDIATDLRASIDRYFTHRTNGPFTNSPISREAIETGPPLVLIFDGLDELATPGDAAKDIANLFVSKLAQLTSEIRGDDSHKLKVIVSGRIPSFQAVKRYLDAADRRSLEVIGFAPYEPGRRPATDLERVDQRPIWWNQYATLTGEQLELPPAFADERLEDISNEPLLCYLLVLSRFALENWEAAAENQNRIYERLINEVWRRGWGEGADPIRRQGAGRNLSNVEFNRLMETIAHAAWLGGDTRTCSEDGFLEAVKINRCEEAWSRFKEDSGADVTNLAMNFYLKASEKSHRGFEFTHKSFGDYLAARALVNQSKMVSTLSETRLDIAMQDWFTATSSGVITREIITFIRDEFRLRATVNEGAVASLNVRRSFSRLASEALRAGFPLIPVAESTYRGVEARQRNAEAALWSVLSGSAYGVTQAGDVSSALVKIDWPTKDAFGKLIDRISGGIAYDAPILMCFNSIVACGQTLYSKRLLRANFMYADVRECNFVLSVLFESDFSGADLSGANFLMASLDGSDFTDALVEGAEFVDASIGGANLIQASKGKYETSVLSIANQQHLIRGKYHYPTPREFQRMIFKSINGVEASKALRKRCEKIEKDIAIILKEIDRRAS